MNPKEILTSEQAPWIDYLTIKKDGERKLKLFTPFKIRKAYKEHLKHKKECSNDRTPK